MSNAMDDLHTIWMVAPGRAGGLIIQAQPAAGPGATVRGAFRYAVPAGPLADALRGAMRPGERWRLAVADDGATIIGGTLAAIEEGE